MQNAPRFFAVDRLIAQGSLKRRKRFITQGKIRETESLSGFEKAGKLSRPVDVSPIKANLVRGLKQTTHFFCA